MDAPSDSLGETTQSPNDRKELLDAFLRRYNFNLLPDLQHGANTMSILIKLRARKSFDFLSLARVADMLRNHDLIVDTQSKAEIDEEIARPCVREIG